MANRWKGNIIAASATTSSGTDFTGKANGAWGLNSQLQQKYAGLWAKGVYAPNAPTIGTASANNSYATINFTASTDSGGGTITSYTATSTPSGITASNTVSPIIVTGLTNDTSYTFTVHANSSLGLVSAESAASNSVTPSAGVNSFLSMTTYSSPAILTYPWVSGTGIGTIYTQPASLPWTATGMTTNVRFSPSSNVLAVTNIDSPYVFAYPWTPLGGGYGIKYSNPSTLPAGAVKEVCFSASGNTIAMAVNGNAGLNSLAVYPWSNGFGTKYANPSGISTSSTGESIAFKGSNTIAMATAGVSPFIYAYPFTEGAGFGTKYANPSNLPTNDTLKIFFNPAGTAVGVTGASSPYLTVYQWSNGFGTKYANYSPLMENSSSCGIFANDGNAIFGDAAVSPYINAFAWSSGFGTKYASPATAPANVLKNISMNATSTDIAMCGYSPAFTTVYRWSSSTGFGTKYAISSGVDTTANGISFGGL